MKYLRIGLSPGQEDEIARPIEIFAVVGSSGEMVEEIPAHGVWGRRNGVYCPFELLGDQIDFGSDWAEREDRFWTIDLASSPIKEGRHVEYSNHIIKLSRSYEITRVSQLVPELKSL